jgi:hypothetical protein
MCGLRTNDGYVGCNRRSHLQAHYKMRARRAPFTDARDGRLKRRVRRAFWGSGGKPLTTTELVKQCYWGVNLQGEKIKSWHRTNVSRVADLLAIRIGRATSQGRPILWSPRPELMQDRRWVGLKHERSPQRPRRFATEASTRAAGSGTLNAKALSPRRSQRRWRLGRPT